MQCSATCATNPHPKQSFLHNYIIMVRILLLWMLAPFSLLAQDTAVVHCKLHSETDPFTKEIKLSTGFLSLSGGAVTIDATTPEVDLLFALTGREVCFDNNSTAFIFFEGTKTKLTIRNGGTMNCEGLFHFIFKNTAATQTNLNKLATQKINRIVFTTTGKAELTIIVKPEMQDPLMQHIQCLVDEAKKLIKQ